VSVRVVVLTSTFPRHRWVAARLAAALDVAGVWQEEKSFQPLRYAGNDDEQRIIGEHFAARDASEAAWFGATDIAAAQGPRTHRVPPGGCNDPGEVASMTRLAPDVVLVFGTGILKRDLIDAFAGRILNLHLGLSPYYRGAGTNFWPLVNREPEYVGATIHYLDEGIDTGPIIEHVRPEILPADGPHDLGNRTIVAAAERLAAAAIAHVAGRLHAVPQWSGGRLYQRKDFSASAVVRMHEQFASGMIPEYLARRTARDARLRLVRTPPA